MTFPFRFSGLALFLVGGMLLLLACPNNVNAHPQCDRFRNKMGSIIYPAPGVTGAINVSFAQLLSFCSQLPVRPLINHCRLSHFCRPQTLGEEQVWWHYGPYSECLPYIASGKISGQYIQRMIDPSNTDPTIDPIAAAGRGFYVAKDPISSSKYGLCSTYVSFGADTLVLDLSILGRVFSGEIAPHSQSKVRRPHFSPNSDPSQPPPPSLSRFGLGASFPLSMCIEMDLLETQLGLWFIRQISWEKWKSGRPTVRSIRIVYIIQAFCNLMTCRHLSCGILSAHFRLRGSLPLR